MKTIAATALFATVALAQSVSISSACNKFAGGWVMGSGTKKADMEANGGPFTLCGLLERSAQFPSCDDRGHTTGIGCHREWRIHANAVAT